jgi:hypothetical protein
MLSETFEKCSILFMTKEGDPALAGLTTDIHLSISRIKILD